MTKLINSLYIFRSLSTIVETIYTVNVHQSAFVACRHQRLTAYGRSKTVTYKDSIFDAVDIQHFIDGMGKEIKCVFHMWLITQPIARQVDEYELQVFAVSESLELLLPRIHVTAEAVNETDSLCIRANRLIPYFIMYADTIVDSNVFRLQFAKRLRLFSTAYQQQCEQQI